MRRFSLILAIGVLALAGCGGDDEEEPASGGGSSSESSESTPAAGGGEQLAISADPSELKFDKAELTAPAGKVTITMANPSDAPHNVVIDADGAKPGDTVSKDGESVASADLQAGEYTYYCAVGNHRSAGMEGTLTVE
jgi:plastocyanin